MDHYEKKQADKKAYYAEKAQKLKEESLEIFKQADTMAKSIPLGQPILIGHHSEKRDRHFRKQYSKLYDKSYELSNKADYYENKAHTVSTAISSDDENALMKLESKLNCLIQTHERMVTINKLYRKEGNACLEKLNNAEKETVLDNLNMIESFYSDTKQKVPFSSYMLSNSNQRIRATRIRIDLLKNELKLQEHAPIQGNGFVLKEDKQDNRILFIFDNKPATEVRALLKRYGFKWSPSRHAWIRMLNQNGRDAAHYVMSHLKNN